MPGARCRSRAPGRAEPGRYRGELANAASKLYAGVSAVVAVRRFLRLPGQSVTVHAGVAGGFGFAGSATVARGMRGPFTAQPGQSLQDQVNELGALVNRLREEVMREPLERERGPSRRNGRPGRRSCGPLADRLEAVARDLRTRVREAEGDDHGRNPAAAGGRPPAAGRGSCSRPGRRRSPQCCQPWPPLRVVLAFLGAYILAIGSPGGGGGHSATASRWRRPGQRSAAQCWRHGR